MNEPFISYQLFDEQIVNDILSIPLKTKTLLDKLVWMVTKSGESTVKSAYNWLRLQQRNQSIEQASSSFQPPHKLWKSQNLPLECLPKCIANKRQSIRVKDITRP